MERAVRWTVTFRTASEKVAVVSIYEDGWTGDVTELTPSDVPFETEETNADDLMAPVRTQTGYLRIINDGSLDESIIPANAMSHYVQLTVDGMVRWCGYMKPDVYSSDWDVSPELELPLVSGLGVLDGIYMDQTKEMGLVTLAELIQEAVCAANVDYQFVYVPKEIGLSSTDSDMNAALMAEVSRYNFFSESDTEYGDEDYQRYESRTYLELLEEVLKLYGWSMMERGRDIYIISTDAGTYYRYGAPIFAWNVRDNSRAETEMESMKLDDLHLDGDGHSLDVEQGMKKITVEVDVNQIGDVVPNVDANKLEKKGSAFLTRWVGSPDLYRTEFRRFYGEGGEEAGVQFKQWEVDADADYTTVDTDFDWTKINDRIGAAYVEYDRYTQEELKDKKNYDLTSAIIMTRKNSDGTPAGSQKAKSMIAVRMYNGSMAKYLNGAFVVSSNVKAWEQVGDTYDNLWKVSNGGGELEVQFRVGDMYWNGEAWGEEKVWFKIEIGTDDSTDVLYDKNGKIISTKTLDMPYNGADGYVMPIDVPLSGEIEFLIHVHAEPLNRITYYFEGLKVKYYQDDDNWVNQSANSGTNKYAAVIGGYSGEKEVKLIIGTDRNNGAAYATLTSGGEYVTSLYYLGEGQMMRPEQALLSKLKRYYGRITRRLTLEVEQNQVSPFKRILYKGVNYAVTGEAIDWRAESEKLTLTEN